MVLGLLYTFTLVPPACPELEYKFTVTRDRNKQYHMYQYTHSYTGMTQEVSGLKVGKTCKQFYEQQQTTEESCGQTTGSRVDKLLRSHVCKLRGLMCANF